MMDLERLDHFIVLAHELHFGRSAKQLGMDQSILTRSIQRLEKSMDVKLFERSRRHVRLTPSGQIFLQEAEKIRLDIQRAARVAKQAALGQIGDLRVGVARTAAFEFIARSIRLFKNRATDVSVQLMESDGHNHIERLRQGDIDLVLAVRAKNDRQGFRGLSTLLLRRYPYVVCVPSAWPIAARKAVRLSELAELPFVLFPNYASPAFHGALITAFQQIGFTPNVVIETRYKPLMLALVAEEMGVGLTIDVALEPPVQGVKALQVLDPPDILYADALALWDPKRETWPVQVMLEELQKAGAAATAAYEARYEDRRPKLIR
jgi:DNA-binding transcriptional LysR family regulator